MRVRREAEEVLRRGVGLRLRTVRIDWLLGEARELGGDESPPPPGLEPDHVTYHHFTEAPGFRDSGALEDFLRAVRAGEKE